MSSNPGKGSFSLVFSATAEMPKLTRFIFYGKFKIVKNKSKNQYEKACCVKENIIFQK